MSVRIIAAVGLSLLFVAFMGCCGIAIAEAVQPMYGAGASLFAFLAALIIAFTALALAWRKHL